MEDDAKDAEQKFKHPTIMVGHSANLETGESAVMIYCAGGNRLSIAGARILAAQIVQWADHAEKRNAERPADTMTRLVYKMMQQAEVKPEDDSNAGKPGYVKRRKSYSTAFEWVPVDTAEGVSGIEVSSEPAPEKAEVHFALRRKKPPVRKTKKAKRGRK